jgi:dipeptidyl-peptidase-4
LIRQLTSGKWVVTDFYGVSADDKTAFFSATKESPICRDLYAVDIKTAKIRRITEAPGLHNIKFSDDLSRFVDDYSSTEIAAVSAAYSADGKKLKELLRDENPLKDYKIGKTSIFTLKSDLGDDLYCRMIKPVDFDSTKRYPVVIYVYGGPHNQLVTNSWLGGAGMFLNYLATKGYIIFGMDNHGTENRGQDFEQVIHRQVGTQEVKDQMVGVDYLRGLPYVDRNRIAVHGWSYGGFLTIMMLVKHPDDFKVGVAGGPVCDWKYYEVMYGERYMDTPQENGNGYEQSAVTNYVDQLKADLLIIHGTMDPTVVQQNSLDFIQKCVKKGILLDYFVYPGHGHNVSGIDRLHLYRKIEQYIVEHL